MITRETELIEIAKHVVTLNKYNLEDLRLAGSLSFALRKLNKRNPSGDIDFICSEYLCEEGGGAPLVPPGFKLCGLDGHRSQVNCVKFVNDEGVKIEFMLTPYEPFDVIDGVPCAELQNTILAKLRYVKNDSCDESRQKHLSDVIYILENNPHVLCR